MVAAVLAASPAAGVAAAIIWIPMIEGDSESAAATSAGQLADPRATHFYDPQRLAGAAVAGSIGAPSHVAWDMYLFYEPAARWPAAEGRTAGGVLPAPPPATWFHQLGGPGREWADPSRYRWSEALAQSISEEALRRWRPSH